MQVWSSTHDRLIATCALSGAIKRGTKRKSLGTNTDTLRTETRAKRSAKAGTTNTQNRHDAVTTTGFSIDGPQAHRTLITDPVCSLRAKQTQKGQLGIGKMATMCASCAKRNRHRVKHHKKHALTIAEPR